MSTLPKTFRGGDLRVWNLDHDGDLGSIGEKAPPD